MKAYDDAEAPVATRIYYYYFYYYYYYCYSSSSSSYYYYFYYYSYYYYCKSLLLLQFCAGCGGCSFLSVQALLLVVAHFHQCPPWSKQRGARS
jgi:hypothetical protein